VTRGAADLDRHLGPADFERAMQLDEAEAFPEREIAALDAWGFGRHFVPAELGGELVRAESTFALIRALSRRDLTVAIAKSKTLLGALPVWIAGERAQAEMLGARVAAGDDVSLALTERAHGSDLLASEVRAAVDPAGGYRLSGEKWLINNATRARWVVVLAATGATTPPGPRGLSLLLADKNALPSGAYEVLPKIRTLGIRGADISGIRFNDAPLPDSAVVGAVGRGFDVVVKTFQVSRTLCAALSVGALETAFDIVLGFVRGRRLYGRALWDVAVVREQLVRALVDLWIAESLAFVACRSMHDRPAQMSVLSAVTKFAVPSIADAALRDLATVLGARYYLREETACGFFQKVLRDHALVPLFDGSTQANLYAIASQLRALADTFRARPASALVETLEPRHPPAPLALRALRITSRGDDDVLPALAALAGEDGPIGACARALTTAAGDVMTEAAALSGGDVLDAPRAFALAASFSHLIAGAACVLAAKAGAAPGAPLEWVHLATLRVLGWIGRGELLASSPAAAAAVGDEIERRAATGRAWGLLSVW
jgi:alkylation response protein AidB-like acyl-CoA dehydrogenase